MVLTDREPLALHCALMSARASGVADEADTMAALRLLEGQALQHAPRVWALYCSCRGLVVHGDGRPAHALIGRARAGLIGHLCSAGQRGGAGLDTALQRAQVRCGAGL